MYLGLDIGGTFLKGSVMREDHEGLIGITRRPVPIPPVTASGRAEIDPNQLIASVEGLCRELKGEFGRPRGILLTGQMHGFCLTDTNLVPVLPVVTWRDRLKVRVGTDFQTQSEYIRTNFSPQLQRKIGRETRDGVPAGSIVSRREDIPTGKELVPHSLLSFVSHSLADRRTGAPIMHTTDAAAHGLLDVDELRWSQEAIRIIGLDMLKWPEVTTNFEPVGESSEFGCPVFVAVGDQQAALLGNELQTNEISLNIATGSQVSKITIEDLPACQIRPYFGGHRIATITHIPAGRSLNALVRLLSPGDEQSTEDFWKRLTDELEIDDSSDLQLDLSFFPSATGDTGSITNIREDNLTVRSLFAAAIHSMTSTYAKFIEILDPRHELQAISLTGGLTTRFVPLRRALELQFPGHRFRESKSEDASLAGLKTLAKYLQ